MIVIPESDQAYYSHAAAREVANIEQTNTYRAVRRVATGDGSFSAWVDATHDSAAQWDAYSWLFPVRDMRVLQLGGMGIHAVKFLVAGAREAWVLSPVIEELSFAIALAVRFHVEDRLRVAQGVAEDMPFPEESFDAIYSGGCLHHMDILLAMQEIHRVLSPAGRFACVDPWRAPLYRIGTAIFGKRERDVHCKPLTTQRMHPMYEVFPNARIIHHGTFTRYPMLALWKLRVNLPLSWTHRINAVDDTVCSWLGLRRWGSSVSVLGVKD